MSGGVDSSLAAALLKEQGYDVTGGFIKNWSDTKDLFTGECAWRGERRDAMRVAAQLDIPLLTFDFEKEYRERVLRRMFEEYEAGITPNPDVLCNEEIKFGIFFEEAMKRGFDAVATGHYARIEYRVSSIEGRASSSHIRYPILDTGYFRLLKGVDPEKDQSYFLHRISQNVLRRTMFPIGHLTKKEVRRLAAEKNLPTAGKPDSQGICFIGKLDFHEFLRKKIPPRPGDIVTTEGTVVGRHDGLDAYTIGQRQGLLVSKDGRAWYVAGKDRAQNRLIVVPDREDSALFSKTTLLERTHWIGDEPADGMRVEAAIRYRQTPEAATLSKEGERWRITFDHPVWALAPGQSAVLYRGEECLGGGFIAEEPLH